ncbi:hypothetical protein RUND412_000194 [Rhizina undulata]
MFDLPETKRIRRSDLYSSSPSRSPSPAPAPPSLNLEFEYVAVAPPPAPPSPPANEEDEFEFNLFSGGQTIKLKSPTPPPEVEDAYELAAKSQKRPLGYYILTEEDIMRRREEFSQVVVSGEEIFKQSTVHWPGCSFPWRVIHLPSTINKSVKSSKANQTPTTGTSLSVVSVAEPPRRKKPGKKRRIYLRKERQKIKAAEEARLKSLAGREKFKGLSKEEREKAERDERNRKNREKKIKRRAREKAKKVAQRGELGDAMDVDAEKDSGDEDEE